MSEYYDKNGVPIPLMEWARLFENYEYKRVALYENLFLRVSTVWLGLNHSFGEGKPLIFETMVFPRYSSRDVDCQRYSTLKEALTGHKAMVRKYRCRIDVLFRR